MIRPIVWAQTRPGLCVRRGAVLAWVVANTNEVGVFFHSYRTIAAKLGLSPRFVVHTLHLLSGQDPKEKRSELTLISNPAERAELLKKSDGHHNCRASMYRHNYANGVSEHADDDAPRAPSEKPNGARHASSRRRRHDAPRAPSQPKVIHNDAPLAPSDGASGAPMMVHPTTLDGAPRAPESFNEVKKAEPKSAPASAVTSGAGAPQPGKVLDSGGKGKDGTPPPAPPKAPTLGPQPEAAAPSNAYRPAPGAPKPPEDDDDHPFVDDGSTAHIARMLGKRGTMHLAANDAGRITEDDPPQTSGDRERMAAQMARQLEQLGQELKMRAYPPGRFPALTRDEQHDVLMPQRPVPRYLPAEVLNAMPHRQRARAAARP